jgi:hypothetical protein
MPAILESLASHGSSLEESIGAGGYGVVYRATSLRFQKEQFVVTALLNSTDCSAVETVEFDALLSLTHPRVLNL